MNIAIIFAGGTGQRMTTHSSPKQFLKIHGKPIIIYTLEHFYLHEEIDHIIIVCLKEYIEHLNTLLSFYGMQQKTNIISGGQSGQESIFKGLDYAAQTFPQDSIVLIHDGVRPFIDKETISKNIEVTQKHGNAITIASAIETIIIQENNSLIKNVLNREICYHAKAPQTFFLKHIYSLHKQAQKDNYTTAVDSASLMQHYGHHLHTVLGSDINIKITTPKDFYFMRALIDMEENNQLSLL